MVLKPSAKFGRNFPGSVRDKRRKGLPTQEVGARAVCFALCHSAELPHRIRERRTPITVISHVIKMAMRVATLSIHHPLNNLHCPNKVLPKSGSERSPSLPLDPPRRLSGHVVDHPIDALDLVDDPGRSAGQKTHVVAIEVGGHAVELYTIGPGLCFFRLIGSTREQYSAASSDREIANSSPLLSFKLLAQDFEAEPVVLGAGERFA